MQDQLIKGIFNNGNILIYVATSTNLVEAARQAHDLWPTSSAALGRTLTMGAILGKTLKNDGEKITIQINGGGPIGTILVDANRQGDVRGFVGDPHLAMTYQENGKLAVGTAVGKDGYLKVSKDISLKSEFTGTVALVSGEIGEDFAYYFSLSEQTPSAVSLGVLVANDNSVLAAGGILLQLLPGATDIDSKLAENIVANLPPVSSLVASGNSALDIINSLKQEINILETSSIRFYCDCSKERFQQSLKVLELSDLKEMIDDVTGTEVVCNYCNKHYHFTQKELEEIYHEKLADQKH